MVCKGLSKKTENYHKTNKFATGLEFNYSTLQKIIKKLLCSDCKLNSETSLNYIKIGHGMDH